MASHSQKSNFHTDRGRLIKDKVAQFSIFSGGVMVLAALLMIFFYLLYVVAPIFESASVTPRNEFTLPVGQKIVAAGMEEQTEIAYLLTQSGMMDFYHVKGLEFGKKINSSKINLSGKVTSFAQSAPHLGLYAYGFDNGEITLVHPKFEVSFPNDTRVITPGISYPIGDVNLLVDEHAQAIKDFAFSVDEGKISVLAQTQKNKIIFTVFTAEENFMTDEIEWIAQYGELDVEGRIDELLISPDGTRSFVRSANKVFIFNTRDIDNISLIQGLAANEENSNLVSSVLLAGANSLLFNNDNGEISQWFEVLTDQGREFTKVRTFNTADKNITAMFPEFYRRTFFTVNQEGDLGLYYTTSESILWLGKVANSAISHFAISPRSDAALVIAGNTVSLLDIVNEHPEVSWSGLWNEVWYEGYSEPGYTWQSTSASDDFESKFSLIPISFGTIKAAFYAMLFAVPIALSAAVYTAYFMSPQLRKVVKPTIEIMEALPTVILGFLAGLWLAPIFEEHLPAILILLFGLPLSMLATAFGWSKLPQSMRNSVPEGSHSLLLIPVVLLLGVFAFSMSPLVESLLFGGDVRQYLTNDLGLNFDQRNSLVVGIAMGFAVIPTIFTIAEDAVFSVPKHLTNGSLALGATQWQTLVKVVLLTASPGIFSAIMMGLGRAVGETMIVLMATGNTPIMDWSIFQGMRTLAANIAVEMPESEVGSSHYRILFLAAFVLFIFTFMFNTVAEFVRQRLREKYSSM
ncbi:ABC transporter permease subunit [Pseudoalteromonas denitrificans]|uniref:Phosphate transport system permease protein n=1 Tax=Pseudoalteromonas denitrificans DSM 6059 TaxID=1123010 RepID=A0A1I1E425_9GAMM|nr:ABC transporter permease subunit [Pseudoalteromonas denitrificans]SFB81402.1 phosphate transport system permease protein [Pseudoalteromonas denitrificans DSM 6059]